MTYRLLNHLRLVGDQMRIDSHGQILFNPPHGGRDAFADLQNVAALHHSHGETDGRLAVVAEKRGGRVFVAAGHRRKIAQWHEPAVHLNG